MLLNDLIMLELHNAAFRLGVLPELGGCITHLTWRHPSGREIDLMRRGDDRAIASGNPSSLASFPMVPFANRIDGGRIPLAGGEVNVPVNRPEQGVAIHGFGRHAVWSVADHRSARVRLTQGFAETGNPYTYSAEQIFVLAERSVHCSLSVTNRGRRALPFGIGFHPWFERTPRAMLKLEGKCAFRMDVRQMPLEPLLLDASTGTSPQFVIAARTPLDTPVAGWDGHAVITWPERRTRLSLEAGGAFGLVHLFSPRESHVFCVEPVSHMPDVVNRRGLAEHGDMTMLEPGQSLSGTMRLLPEAMVE
jgi:aldose 1-epimerase